MKLLEEKSTILEEVQDGVNDVEIIRQLFKNMTLCYVDDASEK
jgi:hypothetical protein